MRRLFKFTLILLFGVTGLLSNAKTNSKLIYNKSQKYDITDWKIEP